MSWQASLFCLALRWTVKRAAQGPLDVARARTKLGTPGRRVLHVPPGVTVTALKANGLSLEHINHADQRDDLLILYLHGGGYIFGSPQTHRQLTIAMAANGRAPVFALDYRLAPEHPLPAALDDAVAAYYWLASQYPQRRIVLAGDSAGGGLAVATAITIRDQRLAAAPVALVLFSPWTDLGGTGGSNITNSDRCAMFTADIIPAVGRLYLGDADAEDPRGSPLFANLHGLPPMQIFASTDEVLLDDSRRLAAKAHDQGVAVELHVVPGVPHVWPLFARVLPEGRASLAAVKRFLTGVNVSGGVAGLQDTRHHQG